MGIAWGVFTRLVTCDNELLYDYGYCLPLYEVLRYADISVGFVIIGVFVWDNWNAESRVFQYQQNYEGLSKPEEQKLFTCCGLEMLCTPYYTTTGS